MTSFLMTLLFSKLRSPLSDDSHSLDHYNLLAVLLAASADVIDFHEYIFDVEIEELIGLNVLYGKHIFEFLFEPLNTVNPFPLQVPSH